MRSSSHRRGVEGNGEIGGHYHPEMQHVDLKTWASGMNKGAVRSMAGSGSMKMPSKRWAALTSSRNTHGWRATHLTPSANCTATSSAVII